MPRHHQSGKHPDRPHKQQQAQQQKHRRQPIKVAPQQVPRDPSPESLDEEYGGSSGGPSAVPFGRNFDALLQESSFRQLGQQKSPLQHQLSSRSSDSASSGVRSLHQRHPLWPDPSLLNAAIALATARDAESLSENACGGAEPSMLDREEALTAEYMQLLGVESLPACLPESEPADEASAASGDESDADDGSDSEQSDFGAVCNGDDFDWLDVDCIAVDAEPHPQPAEPHHQPLSDAASTVEQPPPASALPQPLPPLPPPLPPLPDARPAIRQTRDLSELDEDLDRLLQDD